MNVESGLGKGRFFRKTIVSHVFFYVDLIMHCQIKQHHKISVINNIHKYPGKVHQNEHSQEQKKQRIPGSFVEGSASFEDPIQKIYKEKKSDKAPSIKDIKKSIVDGTSAVCSEFTNSQAPISMAEEHVFPQKVFEKYR